MNFSLTKSKFLFNKAWHFLLLSVLLIVSIIVYTTPFDTKADAVYGFAFKVGKTGTDNARGIVVDPTNNYIYVTGAYSGSAVDFDPGAGTANLTSAGLTDIFLAKYDLSGNLVWAKSMGGVGTENPTDIDIDSSGNIYLTGAYNNLADFDPNAGVLNLNPASAGANDIFLAKYDLSGNLVWAKSMGGTSNDIGIGITVDSSGNVYANGYFAGTADFDPGAGTANLTSAGGNDVFISKLNSSGSFVFVKQFGGTLDDAGYSIDVDSSGNIYTSGQFNGTADFDPGAGTANLTSAGGTDIFVSKLNADGTYNFANKIGSSSADNSIHLLLDSSFNIYITGSFSGTVDFDPGAGTANLTATGATTDIYLAKYNSSGVYQSAYKFGGSGADIGYNINFDSSSNVYITGSFSGTVDFDPGAGTANLTSAGGTDIFIVKLSPSGVFDFAKGMGGASADIGYSIALDSNANVYTTGSFNSTADFDPGAGTANLTSAGGTDIFVSKLTQVIPASITITPSTDISIAEGVNNPTAYTVSLGSAPTSNVTIIITESSNAINVENSPLTFTPANWNTSQSVSITGSQDANTVSEADQAVTFDPSSADAGYNALPNQTRNVDITDNDTPSFSITPATDITMLEGSTNSTAYQVVLGTEPASNVVIDITESSPQITLNTTSLTFTSGNWNVAQDVSVTATEDNSNSISEVDQPVTFAINDASSDNQFDPLVNQTRQIDFTDNDTPSFSITQTGGNTSVVEEGATDTFSIVLGSQPSGNVVIDVSSSDTTALTLSVPSVSFSAVDWNIPKNVTVTGPNDPDTSSENVTITASIDQAQTADPLYDPLLSQNFSASVTDNDIPVDIIVYENKLPPINLSTVTQKKNGSLIVGGFRSTDYVRLDSLIKIPDGAGNGLVLTSNATGEASWASTGSSSGTTTWGSITGTLADQVDLQNALNLKASLVSPQFSGEPKSNETLLANDNDTSVATTAFVQTKVGSGTGGANGWSDTGSAVSLITSSDNVSIGEESVIYRGGTNQSNRFIHNKGTGNTFLGLNSGSLNLSGSYNTGVGFESLLALNNTLSGEKNTAFGYQSLSVGDNFTSNNTAIGSKALGVGGGGAYNTALGYETLLNTVTTNGTSTGVYNVSVGYQALKNNTTGSYNVAVGSGALINNTTGSYNIAIGYGAGPTSSNLFNTIAIGYGATVSQSNKVRLGNTDIEHIVFQVAPTVVSDLRLKENINNTDLGLEFIKKLRPVSYTMKDGTGIDYGFIAQEVESAIGKKTNIVLTDNTEFRQKSMRYEGLISPLVKAVQEQDLQLENDKKELEDFAKRLIELENKLR